MTTAYDWNYHGEAKDEMEPVPVVETEPSVEEHAQMIQKGFAKILDKALAHTDLTKRVEELEETVKRLQNDVNYLTEQLASEQQAHRETRSQLSQVQSTLAQKEGVIHDLVQERDIVLGERNQAQEQRDSARRECNDWETKYNEAQRTIDGLNGQVTQLTAANEELKAKMETFRNAFRGLTA